MTPDPRTRLIALPTRLAPDVAGDVWRVRDVRELPREVREDIYDLLGYECAEHGLDHEDRLTEYGRELDGLAEALGLHAGRAGLTARRCS
jgi:hypothetical protein